MEKKELDLFDIAPETVTAEELLKPVVPKNLKPKDVVDQAAKTSKSIKDTKKALASKKARAVPGLDAIVSILAADPELEIRGEPPTLEDVRNSGEFGPILDELEVIIEKYKNGFDDVQADDDIIRIAAFLADLSQELGIFQSQAQDARSSEERLRVKAYIKAKTAAITNGARITDTDAKELARYMALEYAERGANLEFVAKYLTNAYYSIKNFVDILNFVSGRRRRAEEKGAQF